MTTRSSQRVEGAPVTALAVLFDDGLPAPEYGEPIPPLWHWVGLARWHPFTASGPDGHARTGGFLPDVGKPRRMFAGGQVEFHASLLVGDVVEREDRVLSVTPKSGRQGDFVLVQIQTDLFDPAGRLAVRERQDLVYRDAPPDVSHSIREPMPLSLEPAVLSRTPGGWSFTTDPASLMRFSSATSNGHRIHYDQPYATLVEGYPGLVVHGPLMTLALAEVVRHQFPAAHISSMTHRNLRPMFCGETAQVDVVSNVKPEVGHSDAEVTLRRDTSAHVTLKVSF